MTKVPGSQCAARQKASTSFSLLTSVGIVRHWIRSGAPACTCG